MPVTVTTSAYKPGAVDEERYGAFVEKMRRFYRRQVAKGANNMKSMYYGWTETDIEAATGAYCRAYRHQYRVLVPIDPVTREPLPASTPNP